MVLPLALLPLAIVCSMVPLDDLAYALADFPQSTTIGDDFHGPVVPCDDFPGPVAHYNDFPWPVAASGGFLDHSPAISALPPPSHHSVLSSSCHPLCLLFFTLFDVVHVFLLDVVSHVV